MSAAVSDDDGAAAGAVVNFIGGRRRDLLDSSIDLELPNTVTTILNDDFGNTRFRIEQFALGVMDFSSQYGIDYSISYTAPNIIGRPSKYPAYGDFPETYAMRTYGDWWERAPSRVREIQSQNLPNVPSHDFIIVYFEDYIIPDEIAIYETFNPGAIIRIWAYTVVKTWVCLWEMKNENDTGPLGQHARRFTPSIKRLSLPTKTIRLEFNHRWLNYYTQLDAILISGQHISDQNTQQLVNEYFEQQRKGSILRKLRNMQFRPICKENYEARLQDFLSNDLKKFLTNETDITTLASSATTIGTFDEKQAELKASSSYVQQSQATFHDLPAEILLHILSYLDLLSLFRVGQVSRIFYAISTHPLLYCRLNLKPYWHVANSELLCVLAKRATVLKQLDLSWCGLFNTISPTEFKKFVQQRGDNLTHLRLNSCKFLNASCIETIGIVCDNLKELTLRNCSTDSPLLNFSCLVNLKNLERLDLFQTAFESELLLTMLESNRKLKHLNLAFCGVSVNMDVVAEHIGRYNQQLVSLDMWKSHFLSASGLYMLARCPDLEELDLGWCLREASLGDSIYNLVTKCTKLKKLFLSTVRSITERDVEHIANYCKNLEQLDLMGALSITKERVHEILVKCTKLELLDLSFCDNILDRDLMQISQWSLAHQVQIKCSHVPY